MTPLLGANDPSPIEVLETDTKSSLLLLCEHAGQAIPKTLGDLGVSATERQSHIGWDVGAGDLARAVSARLNATLILQRYSRLVFDCNRPPDSPGAIPARVAGIPIPGNHALSRAEMDARRIAIFDPMNRAIERALAAFPRQVALSIHSFTETLENQKRPWHAGFLSRADPATAGQLMTYIAARHPDLTLARNEPYRIEDATDWFIPAYAEARGLRHCLIEIRNDQLCDPDSIADWAEILSEAIQTVLDQLI